MEINDYARHILLSSNLDEKLEPLKPNFKFKESKGFDHPDFPNRSEKIKPSTKKVKFPKSQSLHLENKKALAFHFFANHELLAFEIMAASLLIFPTKTMADHKFKLAIINTIEDEKKHFSLYRSRMNEFGVDFGDFPINDFFWRQLEKINTPTQYFSFISLTIEAANLDFAKFYAKVFTELEDFKSAKILELVYKEEIQHVALGVNFLEKSRGDESLWDYYRNNLPDLITPARAKGMNFDFDGRTKAGLNDDFIQKIFEYRDDFKVTDRKTWKNNS